MPGSLTVVGRVWDNPDDDAAWRELQDRYELLIYRYAKWQGCTEESAKSLTVDVFAKIHDRFRKKELGPIVLGNESFKPYVMTVVRTARAERERADKRRRVVEAAAARREGDGPDGQAEFEAGLDYWELFDADVVRCAGVYAEVLKHAHHEPQTWEIFLRVTIGGEKAADVNKEAKFGFTRLGTAAQSARKVRNRLFDLLGLKYDGEAATDRSTQILIKVVQQHERAHPDSEY